MGICNGRYVSSSPAIGSDGTVYVGSDDKKLYAINGKSGVKLWEFETGSCVTPPPPSDLMARFTSGQYGQQALCHQSQEWGQAMGI